MITVLRKAGLLWPSLFVIIAMPTLVALGNWQWNRMHWKRGLLQDLAQAATASPVPLAQLLGTVGAMPEPDWQAVRFRRVRVHGTFLHDHEMHVWAPQRAGPAWSVVTPLRLLPIADRRSGDATHHVLVVRGIVPAASKSPRVRRAGQIEGPQSMVGRIRVDRPNAWANKPNIERNEWFTRDASAMAAHFRKVSGATGSVLPVFVEAEQRVGGETAPKPDLMALRLTNRHLEYAMTWWGLAATLAGVFAAYAWGRLSATQA